MPEPTELRVLNETHDPARRSWVESADAPGDFPIQNLPFGVFHRAGETPRGGVAIGDRVFDLKAGSDLFTGVAATAAEAASGSSLNALLALGYGPASELRLQLSRLLAANRPESAPARARAAELLVPASEVELTLPVDVRAYTDMTTSIYHVTEGRRGRPTSGPPGHFKDIPLGYNGRASSVVVSGGQVARPWGIWPGEGGTPAFGPEPHQDFEMELAVFIGPGNALGERVPIESAGSQIFGYCLLNDWSARAIQLFEMPPLGPFLGKSTATMISPWIVTAEALAPFASPVFPRSPGDPRPLPHLWNDEDQKSGGLDIALEVHLLTPAMREAGQSPARICLTNARYMYWTFAQILTHHTSNGCNLGPGDLIASGTVSGPTDDACGCLWELTCSGALDFPLPNGERRLYLDDGDEVIFRGRAERDGFVPIGFGECRGRLTAARAG